MNVSPRFLSSRRGDVHSARPGSQFAYINRQLDQMVSDLTRPVFHGPNPRVLDFGCADQPYRHLLPSTARYVSADLPGNDKADVALLPDGTVPLGDGTFDLVLSTQVLEHVLNPDVYLDECARLLKPGGSLVLSTHGIMYYHQDPEDYWRWTSVGLKRVLEQHGLEVAEQRGILGLSAAALQLLQDAHYWRVPRLLRRPYALVMQLLIAAADRSQTDDARINNGLVIAVRAMRRGAPKDGAT